MRAHRTIESAIVLALASSAAACAPAHEAEPILARPLRMPAALTDTNPDPSIVEVALVASVGSTEYLDGKPAEIWAYRDGAVSGSVGAVPGPMLVAKQGDRIIVHFKNELPVPTTVHWHGLRPMNKADGSTSTQLAILPNGS